MTHRIIRDPGGEHWDVWQVEPLLWDVPHGSESAGHANFPDVAFPALLDPALANGWLCFESRLERRRLAPIPSGWERMTDAELHALCAWATVVPRTYGGAMRPDSTRTPRQTDVVPPTDTTDRASEADEPPASPP